MNYEIFASLKSEKTNLIFVRLLLAVFVVFVIIIINGGGIMLNIGKEQQASATNNASSLGDIISGKVKSAIEKSVPNANSLANIIKESKQAGAIDQSTSVNCNNNKCVIKRCVDNTCRTTTENSGSANSAAINIAITGLGDAFYKQNDKPVNRKAAVINGINASEISFSGTGAANGTSFTDTGIALVIPRTAGAMLIQGTAVIKANDTGDKATYSFQEIGHLAADGMTKASGAAFFGPDATGKLAFLSNVVAIYKDQIDKSGNSKIMAWKWK
jgi:hypothetical protein